MSVKDNILLQKLKDGIEETIVFLRTLEQFRIPAVMESRRKKLLARLLLLQGDTIREEPPNYENGGAATSPTREVGKPDRKSSIVEDKVSEYARIETKAKGKMEQLSPKKLPSTSKPPEVFKEEPAHEPAEYLDPAASGVVERRGKSREVTPERPASAVSAASSTDSRKDETEQVNDGAGASAKEITTGKKKRFGAGGLKVFKNKIGKLSKSKNVPATATVETALPQQNEEPEPENQPAAKTEETVPTGTGEGEEKGEGGDTVEEEGKGEEEVEEGVKIQSQLEKRVAKHFGKSYNWIKIAGKLKETTLILTTGTKEKQLELVGCMVSPSDATPNGIELFSHKEQKQWVFRVESKELRERWVEELQKAIDECPQESRPSFEESSEVVNEEQQPDTQEKPDEDVPEIKIEPAAAADGDVTATTMAKKKRTGFTASPSRGHKTKPVNEIPDQGVQIKGYLHRKKGTFGGWEKVYCVLTYAAIYFTSGEDVREYHHVCMLSGSGTVKHEKRGHDKQSEGLLVKSGKNKETLSLAASDVQSWRQILEDVLGVSGGDLELGSEDEDEGVDATTAAPPIDEDQGLYEELPAGDEIEEDIYEEFDEPPASVPSPTAPSLPPPRQDQRAASPKLPSRNEATRGALPAEPTPSLPPRGSPSLPPRSSPVAITKAPQKGASAGAKKTAPPPQQDTGGEELYEDVVAPVGSSGGNVEVEELYEDVVSPQGTTGGDKGGEELYEDIVAPSQQVEEVYDDIAGAPAPSSPTEDYTEMDIGQATSPTEDYVIMEKPQQANGDQEVYCEVDSDSPQHAPINSISLPPKGVAKSAGNGKILPPSEGVSKPSKILKPPPPATYVPKHSGSLSHKAPKKSRFYEEWCAVEGTNLCTYKSQKDKRTVEKISLSEFDMAYTPGKDGKYTFRLTKDEKVHHFNPSSKVDLTNWVSALRNLAKSATLELPSGEAEVYQATADHTAESDEQMSFKEGAYIRVISRATPNFWIGQLGSSSEDFSGKIGKFPSSKVTLAEDLYI